MSRTDDLLANPKDLATIVQSCAEQRNFSPDAVKHAGEAGNVDAALGACERHQPARGR